MANKYITKLKESAYKANAKLDRAIDYATRWAVKHPIAFRAGLITGPTLIALASGSLDHIVQQASAATPAHQTFSGELLTESYGNGSDGIKGTADDIYSCRIKCDDGTAKDVNFYASDLSAQKLATIDANFKSHSHGLILEHNGDRVTVTADNVNGELKGADMVAYVNPHEEADKQLCFGSLFVGTSSIFALIGGYVLKCKYENWRDSRAQKKAKKGKLRANKQPKAL